MNVSHMFVWLFWLLPASWGELPPPCYSEIFCLAKDTHSLLHVVQMANIHKDSKTFVDKSLKTSPREVLQKFDELMKVCYKHWGLRQLWFWLRISHRSYIQVSFWKKYLFRRLKTIPIRSKFQRLSITTSTHCQMMITHKAQNSKTGIQVTGTRTFHFSIWSP